jgi:hypothetical protein
MRPLRIGLGVLLALTVVGAGFFLALAERITLVADAAIDVADRAASDPSQVKVIASLQPGEQVPVTSCVDLKHFIAPQIEMTDGTRGYVLVGKFHLRREPWWSSSASPIVLSCPKG